MILITKQVNGTKEDKPLFKVESNIDENNSKIWAGSTFCALERDKNEEIQDVTSSKDSDDKVIIGYTEQGLPIQIIADGFYRGGTEQFFAFIDTLIVFLENKDKQYISRLISGEDYKKIIEEMIRDIFEYRKNSMPDANFTMAIAITYRNEKDYKLYTTGFGIGDIGMVLRKKEDDKIHQLTFNTSIYNKKNHSSMKDAFDNYSENRAGIENVISRNSVFCKEVSEGDEIFSYTSLLKGMENESSSLSVSNAEETIIKKSFKSECLGEILNEVGKKQISLFDRALKILKEFEKKETDEAISALVKKKGQPLDWPTMFGDDCTLISVVIPSFYVQDKIQVALSAKKYLQWMEDNASNHRIIGGRFSYMCHGSSGKNRAKELFQFCETTKVSNLNESSLFKERVLQFYNASGHQPNSLRSFLDASGVISPSQSSRGYKR